MLELLNGHKSFSFLYTHRRLHQPLLTLIDVTNSLNIHSQNNNKFTNFHSNTLHNNNNLSILLVNYFVDDVIFNKSCDVLLVFTVW